MIQFLRGGNQQKKLFLLLCFALVLSSVFWLHPKLDTGNKTIIFSNTLEERAYRMNWDRLSGGGGSRGTRCQPRSPDIFNKDIRSIYSQPNSVNCPKEFNKNFSSFYGIAFAVKNGSNLHRLVDLELPCCYEPFCRTNDDGVRLSGNCTAIQDTITVIPKNMEYIKVTCQQKIGNKTVAEYRQMFPLVHLKPFPPNQAHSPNGTDGKSSKRLNIVIIGLDATSQLNFQRHMPLSREYLLDSMDAIPLEGYSVVGAGTRANLAPMLSGLSLRYPLTHFQGSEFAQYCVNRYKHFDNCSFIWKEFSRRGYLTTFADDWTIFNEHWPGAFKNPPTDYYLRPYTVHMQKFARAFTASHFCFGPQLSIEAVLGFAESVREAAEKVNRSYFQLTWITRLAHNKMNYLGVGDAPLVRSLMRMKASGATNNTIIFVLGDHGHGQGFYPKTVNGQQEYALPVAYIVLPPWFPDCFPEEYNNLRRNAKKMTTPYDIFSTLEHLVDFGQVSQESVQRKGHGTSLFRAIPESRSCVKAGVSLQWCSLCHPIIPLDSSNDPFVKVVADFVVASANGVIKDYGSECVRQSVHNVSAAWYWDSRDVLRQLCDGQGKLDVDKWYFNANGIEGDLKGVSCDLVDIVRIHVRTNSSGAFYNAEVVVIRKGRRSVEAAHMFLTDDPLRFDWYYKTGKCVNVTKQQYCVCKPKNVTTITTTKRTTKRITTAVTAVVGNTTPK